MNFWARQDVRDGDYDAFFHGQRMVLPMYLSPGMDDHDIDDSGGIIYWDHGQRRTSWHYAWMRMSGPDWHPFRIPLEGPHAVSVE
jgi:hypothetical protein